MYVLMYKLALFISILLWPVAARAQVSFGVFADVQYYDGPPAGVRHYRQSLSKLQSCLQQLNRHSRLRLYVGLGDLIDRHLQSYDTVQAILGHALKPVYHVVGNHDLDVEPDQRTLVPEKLGLRQTWYTLVEKKWMFIFLNGYDLSFYTTDSTIVRQARHLTEDLKARHQPNYHPWNGAIGMEQQRWLKEQLVRAEQRGLKVVLFCHLPLWPHEAHALWNHEEILQTLQPYRCVKAWFNGHNHAGNYGVWEGIHCVNLKGMVDTPDENAFATVKLTRKKIIMKGYGREPSRRLRLR